MRSRPSHRGRPGERRGRRPRRGPSVVNSAGEDEAHLIGRNSAVEPARLRWRRPVPRGRSWTSAPHGRRTRAPPGRSGATVTEVLVEQAGRGRVQVGGDAVVSDCLRERGDIADAGHRPLKDRVTRALSECQRRALGERTNGLRR